MILDKLAAHAKQRVAAAKAVTPMEVLREQALRLPKGAFLFERAISRPRAALICEIKKASPSKGVIAEEFPYRTIAREYESGGADCLSCLTEPKWFLGSDAIFSQIRAEVGLPMLRKDFTVDEYQLYEAKLLGADAVLLICALLPTDTVARYLGICDEMGIAAIVEAHDAAEIRSAVDAGARVIGVNNRNLKDFTVDFQNAQSLRKLIPPDKLFIAESGVHTPEDVKTLRNIGADAVLIGEVLMRADDRRATLAALLEAAQ